jgi:hypothetical protein
VTPEQEEQVRRALAAAARADRPDGEGAPPAMPPEVTSRLDDVLAELVAGRSARTGTGPAPTGSDDLAERRARKWPNVLVAAATVAVIAVAGGAVATRGFGGGSGSSGSSAASAGDSSEDRVAPEAGQGVAPSAGATGSRSAPGAPEPSLRSASLAADVQRLVGPGPAGSLRSGGTLKGDGARPDGAACELPAAGRGAELVAVRLDGKPATLVLDPPADGTREARVYSCDDGSVPVATTSARPR